MKWNNHSSNPIVRSKGHAFLSPSKYHWMNYDFEKLLTVYQNQLAVEKGVELHKFAETCIRLRERLPRKERTLNMYVNDAISYNLEPELVLFYSENCFGTTDAIGFNKNFLRIHDLKTGTTPASLHQLEIYAALFCLEYGIKPETMGGCELRIYQNDDVLIGHPGPDVITYTMDRIKMMDKVLTDFKNGGILDVQSIQS